MQRLHIAIVGKAPLHNTYGAEGEDKPGGREEGQKTGFYCKSWIYLLRSNKL